MLALHLQPINATAVFCRSCLLRQSGPAAATLESRVRQLEEDLRRVERERDVLKKALAIFSQRT